MNYEIPHVGLQEKNNTMNKEINETLMQQNIPKSRENFRVWPSSTEECDRFC